MLVFWKMQHSFYGLNDLRIVWNYPRNYERKDSKKTSLRYSAVNRIINRGSFFHQLSLTVLLSKGVFEVVCGKCFYDC